MSKKLSSKRRETVKIKDEQLSRSVKVSNILPGTTKERVIIHFQKERNGGGDIDDVVLLDEQTAVVIFDSEEVAQSVLTKRQTFNGVNLELQPYRKKQTEPCELFSRVTANLNPAIFQIQTHELAKFLEYVKSESGIEWHEKSDGLIVSGTFAQVEATQKILQQYLKDRGKTGGYKEHETSSDDERQNNNSKTSNSRNHEGALNGSTANIAANDKQFFETLEVSPKFMKLLSQTNQLKDIKRNSNIEIIWDGKSNKLQLGSKGEEELEKGREEFITLYQRMFPTVVEESVLLDNPQDVILPKAVKAMHDEYPVLITRAEDKLLVYGVDEYVTRIVQNLRSRFSIEHTRSRRHRKPAGNTAVVAADSPEGTPSPASNPQPRLLQQVLGCGVMLYVYQGDITCQQVDVIVNAANAMLHHGGGVAGAIARKGGQQIWEESRRIIQDRGKLNIGDAVCTHAGYLPCKAVIHTVGPQWDKQGRERSVILLHRACIQSLRLASQHFRSVALPAISSGIYGVPKEVCAEVMFTAAEEFSNSIDATVGLLKEIHFVSIDPPTVEAFQQELLKRYHKRNQDENNDQSKVNKEETAATFPAYKTDMTTMSGNLGLNAHENSDRVPNEKVIQGSNTTQSSNHGITSKEQPRTGDTNASLPTKETSDNHKRNQDEKNDQSKMNKEETAATSPTDEADLTTMLGNLSINAHENSDRVSNEKVTQGSNTTQSPNHGITSKEQPSTGDTNVSLLTKETSDHHATKEPCNKTNHLGRGSTPTSNQIAKPGNVQQRNPNNSVPPQSGDGAISIHKVHDGSDKAVNYPLSQDAPGNETKESLPREEPEKVPKELHEITKDPTKLKINEVQSSANKSTPRGRGLTFEHLSTIGRGSHQVQQSSLAATGRGRGRGRGVLGLLLLTENGPKPGSAVKETTAELTTWPSGSTTVFDKGSIRTGVAVTDTKAGQASVSSSPDAVELGKADIVSTNREIKHPPGLFVTSEALQFAEADGKGFNQKNEMSHSAEDERETRDAGMNETTPNQERLKKETVSLDNQPESTGSTSKEILKEESRSQQVKKEETGVKKELKQASGYSSEGQGASNSEEKMTEFTTHPELDRKEYTGNEERGSFNPDVATVTTESACDGDNSVKSVEHIAEKDDGTGDGAEDVSQARQVRENGAVSGDEKTAIDESAKQEDSHLFAGPKLKTDEEINNLDQGTDGENTLHLGTKDAEIKELMSMTSTASCEGLSQTTALRLNISPSTSSENIGGFEGSEQLNDIIERISSPSNEDSPLELCEHVEENKATKTAELSASEEWALLEKSDQEGEQELLKSTDKISGPSNIPENVPRHCEDDVNPSASPTVESTENHHKHLNPGNNLQDETILKEEEKGLASFLGTQDDKRVTQQVGSNKRLAASKELDEGIVPSQDKSDTAANVFSDVKEEVKKENMNQTEGINSDVASSSNVAPDGDERDLAEHVGNNASGHPDHAIQHNRTGEGTDDGRLIPGGVPSNSLPPECQCCHGYRTDTVALPHCGHVFCTSCILKIQLMQLSCPICLKPIGLVLGNQPLGYMTWAGTSSSLPGNEGSGAIYIDYNFPPGIQDTDHPNPGDPYDGMFQRAWLPDNPEGREVLELLRRAFDSRLLFTIGTSTSTGKDNQIICNGVHLKFMTHGGSITNGYPDLTYLSRVKDELAAKGIC